jgi:hypothetical protein
MNANEVVNRLNSGSWNDAADLLAEARQEGLDMTHPLVLLIVECLHERTTWQAPKKFRGYVRECMSTQACLDAARVGVKP